MNVIQVVPSIAQEASGPSYSVPRLAGALAAHGVQVELHVLGAAQEGGGYRLCCHPAWPILESLGISPALREALRRAASRAEIMHSHSLWMMPNVYPGRAVRGTRCLLVTSPRGTLAPWALSRSRWRKRVMWWLGQGQAVRRSHCFHATSVEEYKQVRAAGLRAPVAVIPNGIDMPPDHTPSEDGARRRLLFLGRIHPVKGVDVLLRAWRVVQQAFPEWELHIVGPDQDGHGGAMQELAGRLALERVHFPGPAYGADKAEALRRGELFVLPSHTENFGMAVAEALAHGVPAIVSKGAPWAGLAAHDCGWWIDHGEGPLIECLKSVLGLSRPLLREKGRRGKEWMRADFSWQGVGRMMLQTYAWLLGGGPPPHWVMV